VVKVWADVGTAWRLPTLSTTRFLPWGRRSTRVSYEDRPLGTTCSSATMRYRNAPGRRTCGPFGGCVARQVQLAGVGGTGAFGAARFCGSLPAARWSTKKYSCNRKLRVPGNRRLGRGHADLSGLSKGFRAVERWAPSRSCRTTGRDSRFRGAKHESSRTTKPQPTTAARLHAYGHHRIAPAAQESAACVREVGGSASDVG
jgi:hypothetical protein